MKKLNILFLALIVIIFLIGNVENVYPADDTNELTGDAIQGNFLDKVFNFFKGLFGKKTVGTIVSGCSKYTSKLACEQNNCEWSSTMCLNPSEYVTSTLRITSTTLPTTTITIPVTTSITTSLSLPTTTTTLLTTTTTITVVQSNVFQSLTHNPVSPKSTDRITFTATTSGTATVSEIKIYVDDSTVKTCSISPCSSSLIGPFGAGAHTYKAVARDSSGNVYNSEVKSFTVTVPPPTTTSTTTLPTTTTTAASGCGQYTDDESCILDGVNCGWNSNRNPPCYTSDVGSGTAQTTTTITVVQSNVFQSLTHNPVSPKSTDRITFTATTSGTATVSEIKIYVDDSTVKTCSISPCSSSLIGPFGAGAHTYKAVARDPSGNVYNSEVKSFTVTVLSPTTTSTTVHTNITTTSTTIIPNPTSTTVQDLNCSELTPPAPDFCLNGTIVNENDERGCIINIRCDVTTTSTTVEYGGQNFKLGPPINFRVTPLKSYILLEWDDATTYEQSNDLSGNAVNGLKSYITGYVAAPTKGFVDKIFGFFKNIFGKKQVGTTVTEKGVPVIYIIERKTKEQPNFQVLAEINSADSCSNLQCAYQDTNVLNGEYYSYRIKAKANIDDQDVFSNYVEPKDNEGDKNIFTPNEEFTTPPSTGYATTTLGENGQVNQPSGIGGGGSYGGSGGSGGADGNNEQQNELYFVPGEENLGSGTDTEYYGSDEQNKRDKTSKKTATNLDEGSSFIYYIIIGIVVLGITGFFIYKKIKKKKKGAVLQNIGVTNVNPALRDYIINTRKTGYKDDVIKNALINAGWNQQDVDDAFKNLK